MDAESCTTPTTTASSRYSKHRDLGFMGLELEEMEMEVEEEEYYGCPFCEEDFDLVDLCCHIDDDHDQYDSRDGVCPICATRVEVDMVAHITLQHANVMKMQRKRSSRKSGSQSTLSLLRKELREGNLQSLFGRSSFVMSSTNAVPDPLLSSLIPQSQSSSEATPSKRGSDENTIERTVQPSPPLSAKDKEERTRRSKFVHELLLSAIFEDKL